MTPKPLILPEPQDIDMLQRMRDAVVALYNEATGSRSADKNDISEADYADLEYSGFYSLTAVYL